MNYVQQKPLADILKETLHGVFKIDESCYQQAAEKLEAAIMERLSIRDARDEPELAQPEPMPPPPDGCAYHNPDDVPLSKVPEGWRFTLLEENDGRYKDIAKMLLPGAFGWSEAAHDDPRLTTYIVPSDTPFPERKPAWELPDPPEGEQWHRTDWTEAMLPGGYRPLLRGEKTTPDDQINRTNRGWETLNTMGDLHSPAQSGTCHCRTTRPLPVKPDPFAAEKAAFAAGKVIQFQDKSGRDDVWRDCAYVPAWRTDGFYRVKPDPVLVPLGPDDVPQGAEFRRGKDRHSYSVISDRGVTMALTPEITFTWADLHHCAWEMRPINGDWQPCCKEAQL